MKTLVIHTAQALAALQLRPHVLAQLAASLNIPYPPLPHYERAIRSPGVKGELTLSERNTFIRFE